MRLSTVLLIAVVALGSFCVGCNKFTRANYETIYVGQPSADVVRTLGDPTVRFDDQWSYIHDSPFYKANIYYRDGKVIKKLWFDEKEMPSLPTSEELNGGRKISAGSAEMVN